LGERIQVIVAEALELRVKDPRLGFITVTDVRVAHDLHEATIFYTVYGTPEEAADTAAALESAKGILRTEVGKRTGIKFTPALVFVRDALPDTSAHIEDLLAKAKHADQEVAARAANSEYAGQADPYKSDEE
jgi:ribosome-binding factor A